ncbi:dienelactone hydrolase family protein [Paenibacillus sp. P26]|nr:dienelactone hydrolase family protein [Paenibacillus sp. P26]
MQISHGIVSENIKIGNVPSLNGYLARPAVPGVYPGIIVCMEIFGVTDHMRDVANRLALQGYIACVPNFYWRHLPEADLPYDAGGRELGMSLMRQLQRESVIDDISAAMNYLAHSDECSKKIGILGFSLGGHIAYLATARLNLQVAASMYGGWIVNGGIPLSDPEPTISLTSGMAKSGTPFLGIVGGKDHLISDDEWRILGETLVKEGIRHELVVYPEAKHGFFCDHRRESYDQEAAADAWDRLINFFTKELTSA